MESRDKVAQLNLVLEQLKQAFVGKDDIIDLMGLCLVARENIFLFGPPGTAKSALVNQLADRINGNSFEYLLTRFTEPNELFGPFDIRELRKGDLVTNTEGMLPEASIIFLDELLNANSAILNSLLMALNERVFKRGKEKRALPALMIAGASNHLPEDVALRALFDRFLVRVKCDNVDPAKLKEVLNAGWKMERSKSLEKATISAEEVQAIQTLVYGVDIASIQTSYLDLVQKLRNAGVEVSDRRAVKLQRLIAASAVICDRQTALLSDLWVLRYIWDNEEQIEIIAGIVNAQIEREEASEGLHPRALNSNAPVADEIYKEVMSLREQWSAGDTNSADRSLIKDRLRYLSGRSEWISNEEQRNYVQGPIDKLWEKISEN